MFARCYDEMAGLTQEDWVRIAVGYGVWTAGVKFQWGCEKFGVMAIPVGPGNIDIHVALLEDLHTTVLACKVSMAVLVVEEIDKRRLGGMIALRKMSKQGSGNLH
jgi:phenylacetate-CoA ligase